MEWVQYDDEDGNFMWLCDNGDLMVYIDGLEVWDCTPSRPGNRAKARNYTLVAGPFDSLEATKAAYLLMLDSSEQGE